MKYNIANSIKWCCWLRNVTVMDITKEATDSQPACFQVPLLHLNEDCLLKVFSYLNIVDLINVSETCTRLQDVAKIASKKHNIFRLWDYKCYKNKVKEPMTLGKILTFTAPFIVSLELWQGVAGKYIHGLVDVQDHLKLDRTLKRIYFTKLKSLDIDNSSLLQCITFYDLEELKLREVNQNDLNNFTEGLTTLKKLTIGRIHEDASSDELRSFLEKNPNIESLEFYMSFPNRFPYNVLPQLRKLTKLSLIADRQLEWDRFLHIEMLTELKVDLVNGMSDASNLSFINYLENLAQKNTLKKLEVTNMSFRGQTFNTLQLLDVPKLRFASLRGDNHFFLNFEAIALSNLTHLDVMRCIDENDLFHLIEKFNNLQRLKAYYSQGFNNESFFNRIPQFFDSSTTSRTALTLINYCEKNHITISFALHTYEVLTYPSADLKQWDGESVSMERSMLSDWYGYRVEEHINKTMQVSRRKYESCNCQNEL